MPHPCADGIKDDLCSLQSIDSRYFRKLYLITDGNTNFSEFCRNSFDGCATTEYDVFVGILLSMFVGVAAAIAA